MIVYTLLNHELRPSLLTLELSTSLQIPAFQLIGLPGPEVSEAKDRVKAALENADFEFPRRKVVLNLSPSSVRKQGTGMDLAMALALIADEAGLEDPLFGWGELGLDGRVKSAGQVFRALEAAFQSQSEVAFFSATDRSRAESRPDLIEVLNRKHGRNLRIAWVSHLGEVLDVIAHRKKKKKWPESLLPLPVSGSTIEREADLLPGVGLPSHLQRIVGVASAGEHHVFLAGARGAGKSLSLEWLAALRPRPSPLRLLEQALVSELKGEKIPGVRLPVRRVGVQVKPQALYGAIHAGVTLPGEFTLATGSLLIADEFPEWQRDSREALREPLERGRITLSRVGRTVELPADFQLAANGNLCPCGGEWSDQTLHLSMRCRCLPQDRARYQQRISGPIVDRMDLIYRVPTSPPKEVALGAEEFQNRVREVRERLNTQHGKPPGKLSGSELETLLEEEPTLKVLLDSFTFSSYRERHRTLRVALTLAAWDGADKPQKLHFHEIQFMRDGFLAGGAPL